MDRRDALRKAAVAGTIVWTAPVVLDRSVGAQTACTPKCGPPDAQQPQVTITLARACDDAAQERVWTLVEVELGSVINCPCGGTTALQLVSPPLDTVVARTPYDVEGSFTMNPPVITSISCPDRRQARVARVCDGITTTNDFFENIGCAPTTLVVNTSTPCPGDIGCG